MASGGIHKEIRIVLVGKNGVDKSNLLNSLLQRPKSEESVNKDCTLGMLDLDDGTSMVVADTPVLFDKPVDKEVSKFQFMKCIGITSPGPHMFVCVLSLLHLTPEELEPIQYLKSIFGDRVMEFVIVVFTNKDGNTGGVKDYISKHPVLKRLLPECKERYTTICNKVKSSSHKNDVQSVINLIRRTTRTNDNTYYTEQMFQEAESAIIKEIHRRQRTETTMNKHAIRRNIRLELQERNIDSPPTVLWESLAAITAMFLVLFLPFTLPILVAKHIYDYFTR